MVGILMLLSLPLLRAAASSWASGAGVTALPASLFLGSCSAASAEHSVWISIRRCATSSLLRWTGLPVLMLVVRRFMMLLLPGGGLLGRPQPPPIAAAARPGALVRAARVELRAPARARELEPQPRARAECSREGRARSMPKSVYLREDVVACCQNGSFSSTHRGRVACC